MRKITDKEIESGEVMGPLLVVVLSVVIIVSFSVFISFWVSVILILLIAFGYLWFYGIPHAWNYFVNWYSK